MPHDISTRLLRDIESGAIFGLPASNASDNLPRPVEVAEPIRVRGIIGETISLTRCDTSAVLEIDDGLICADAHLCIDRLRELIAAGQRVVAEIEARTGIAKVIPIGREPPGTPFGPREEV